MATDEERIRQEIAGAVIRSPAAAPAAPSPMVDPPAPAPRPASPQRERRPGARGAVMLCGLVGLLVIFFGAAAGGLYGPALVVAGSVFLGSAFIVEAITQLRVDLWLARSGSRE